jgi:hypothetical protein
MAVSSQGLSEGKRYVHEQLEQPSLLLFEHLSVCIVTVFDLGIQSYNKSDVWECVKGSIQEILSSSDALQNLHVGTRKIDRAIYDCEFAEQNKDFAPYEAWFEINHHHAALWRCLDNIHKELSWEWKADTVPATLVIESYGIGVLRVEWKINTAVDQNQAITLASRLGAIVDEILFKDLFASLLAQVREPLGQSLPFLLHESLVYRRLTEYLTGTIFVSFDKFAACKEDVYKQLSQMLWLYSSAYQLREPFTEKAREADLSLVPENVFIISRPASIGVFTHPKTNDREDLYVEERIQLIETLYCQMFLLKRLDVSLNDLLIVHLNDNHHASEQMLRLRAERILAMQQEALVLTEFYRNTRVTTSSDYRRLLEAGNEAFGLARLYESVQEKLNHAQALTVATLDELRNVRLEWLQWAAIVFALLTGAKDFLNPLTWGLIKRAWHLQETVATLQESYPVGNVVLSCVWTVIGMMLILGFVRQQHVRRSLRELGALFERQVLTPEEYERMRTEILRKRE